MRKRKPSEDRINHDRWLVSYADLITLLFAFFVVMYSVSSLNENKYRAMSESVSTAFGKSNNIADPLDKSPIFKSSQKRPDDPLSSKSAPSEPLVPLGHEREKMKELAENLLHVLAPLIREGKIRVTQTRRGISIDISDSVLFASGEAKLTSRSSQALASIAPILASDVHEIQVEGFTDDRPIKNGLFPSNWELSAVRASSVVRFFIEQGIVESRFTAIGQGPKMPVGDNQTLEGRSKNRRVNITILAMLPENKTEVPLSGTIKRDSWDR